MDAGMVDSWEGDVQNANFEHWLIKLYDTEILGLEP